MARMNSSQSKVAAARPESISMRTTIPTFLAKKMNLNVGDTLNWDLDKIDGEWVMTIRKAKNATM